MFDEYFRISKLQSRAVTQENIRGEKGRGGMEENGKKGRPAFRNIAPGETKVLCDIEGQGMIRHLWMTLGRPDTQHRLPEIKRNLIIKMYWDHAEHPSVIAPVGDFFGVAHGRTTHYMSMLLGTPQGLGNQCYFRMPFRRNAKITVTNEASVNLDWLFYQVDYTLGDTITDDMGYFHAHFRRENPTTLNVDYTLLDVKDAAGVYVGAVVGVNPLAPGWWGEGELKIYLDGDTHYPTICGTGTEDYPCAGWGFGKMHDALYSGLNYTKDNTTDYTKYVSFYRFHLLDPVYFHGSIKVQLQQIGAGVSKEQIDHPEKYPYSGPYQHTNGLSDWLYNRVDDVCSCVYWYQDKLGQRLPDIPAAPERNAGIDLEEANPVNAKEGGI